MGDHSQRIRAMQFLGRALHGAEQIVATSQIVMDEVRNHLGISLGFKLIAKRLQALALLLVVLDDAVVDQGHPLAHVRMRVLLGHAAVCGPAGVADAEMGVEAFS